ncbi:MAG: SLATT domain-containing protein [Pseudomonadota bacterium]
MTAPANRQLRDLHDVLSDHPLSRTSLNRLKDETKALLTGHYLFYETNKKSAKEYANVIALIAIVLLAISLISPALSGLVKADTGWFQQFSQDAYRWAYLAAILAGVAMLFDRHFLFSRNWVKRSSVAHQIKSACEELDLNWAIIELKFTGDIVNPVVATEAIELLKSTLSEVNKLVLQETEKWGDDVIASRQALTEKIDKQQQHTQEKLNEMLHAESLHSQANAPGLIQVELENGDSAVDGLTLSVGENALNFENVPENCIFEGVSPGMRVLKAQWTIQGGKQIERCYPVAVKAGAVASQKIDLKRSDAS